MANRSRELELLTREVETRFRRTPNCPQSLVVELNDVENVRIAFNDRELVFNPLFVDTAMDRPEWPAQVLAQLVGVGGLRVAEIGRRAALVAGLRPPQVAFLAHVANCGAVLVFDPQKLVIAVDLAQKGMLDQLQASTPTESHSFYMLTEFGRDALAAHG